MSRGMFLRGRWRKGFTLVELLVVIAIIGVLVSILLPAVGAARAAARRNQNQTNLRSIGQAMMAYEEARKSYPQLVREYGEGPLQGDREAVVSWAFDLLPYLDQANIVDQLDREMKPFQWPTGNVSSFSGNPNNQVVFSTPLPIYANPQRRDASKNCPFQSPNASQDVRGVSLDYAANVGVVYGANNSSDVLDLLLDEYNGSEYAKEWGPFSFDTRKRIRSASVRDGGSNTIAVGDRWCPLSVREQPRWDEVGLDGSSVYSYARVANFVDVRWAKEPDLPQNQSDMRNAGVTMFPMSRDDASDEALWKFGGEDNSQTCFLFLDGRVSWIQNDVDVAVYRALLSMADGVAVDLQQLN